MKIKWSMRSIWHYVIGFFAGVSWVWSPALPPTILGGFVAYEWLQDKNIYRMKVLRGLDAITDSHLDIYEAAFALPFGVGLGAGLKFLGVV